MVIRAFYGDLDKVPQPVLPGELYNLVGVLGSPGGNRPKYIIPDCRFFLDWENGILLIRLQFMPLCFRLKE